MKTCATLFSGGGLADVGLRAAGYTPVLAVEWDEAIAGVYADNHGAHVLVSPVEAVDYRPYAGVDLLWASPCCTNASVAKTDAKEQTEDICAALGVCRAIREMRPRLFCLENVWGYRRFESFHRIVRTLWECGYSVHFDHFNAANYGVHQTRQRLILRAVLGAPRVPTLIPTHTKEPNDGGLFGELCAASPWGGWYAAVEDLLPSLPESKFADWQLKRLPESLAASFLLMTGNTSDEQAAPGVGILEPQAPANSVYAQPPSMRAWLMSAVNGDGTALPRQFASPAHAVVGTADKARPKAFLVDCVHRTDAPLTVRTETEPAHTMAGSLGRREVNLPRALLVNSDNASRDLTLADGESRAFAVRGRSATSGGAPPRALLVSNAKTEYSDGLREAEAPAFATTGEAGGRLRALLERGRVVSMTARALARFQSVPDSYRLPLKNALAYRVVGNGVPCLLAQRVAESLETAL